MVLGHANQADGIIVMDPMILGAGLSMLLGVVAALGLITYFKKWPYVIKNWIATVDHKRIGILYIVVALLMMARGLIDAMMMRAQTAVPDNTFLNADHYNQVFTTHSVIMIFFMAMPLMFGLFNVIVPLKIGARDVAYPFLNALSFWLFLVGCALINISFVIGGSPDTGWLAYPPLSGKLFSPGYGQDYYIWALVISGIGSTISGINFVVTILKMRAPGMALKKMSLFVWSVLSSSIMIVASFPFLTVALLLLFLDRYFGLHIFTADAGGNAMMYINLIWAWGHPEVYILILPAFGIFSEIAATFSKKKLFGYMSMVYAMGGISILGYIVWAHHFFTMGTGADVNAFFGIATMAVGIPTGVKIFNWLFTMYRGRVALKSPVLFLIGFIVTFSIGGLTGIILSAPAADYQLHNSYFLVAHFHNTIVGGVIFGFIAGIIYWWPKIAGYKLNEKINVASVIMCVVGFFATFIPVYILGFMGATRRMYTYSESTGFGPLQLTSAVGGVILASGIMAIVVNMVYSAWKFKENQDLTGDPWGGRTLEWSIPSPAPFYNFARTPYYAERDAFWEEKHNNGTPIYGDEPYEPIHMPKSSLMPAIQSGFWFVLGFGFVWDLKVLIGIGALGIIGSLIHYAFYYDRDYYVTVEEIEATEKLAKEGKLYVL